MADRFDVGETVICSVVIRDDNGDLQNPATSTKIEINQLSPSFASIISSTAMSEDSTGKWHYDFASSGKDRGGYEAVYTATDGTRITIEKDKFSLE